MTRITKTANIKIVVLQAWHIFTKPRTRIAMFYLNLKLSVHVISFITYRLLILKPFNGILSQKSHVRTILHYV